VNMPTECEHGETAIAKARDLSSAGKSQSDDEAEGRLVYGSAPESSTPEVGDKLGAAIDSARGGRAVSQFKGYA